MISKPRFPVSILDNYVSIVVNSEFYTDWAVFINKHIHFLVITFFLTGSLPLVGTAQDLSLRGRVSDATNGEPLPMAHVTVQLLKGEDELPKGTTTDDNGVFELTSLRSGSYEFKVSFVGYHTHVDTLSLDSSTPRLVENVALRQKDQALQELTVSEKRVRSDHPGHQRIEAEQISRVPTPAGSGDFAGYIQSQPGVVATGDRGGQLFIRGGTPSQNLVLMDGAHIFQPFHILGFFSAFPEDVLSEVDFYAGGFGPRYSGRTSSVMDIRLKNGNLYDPSWSASVSPFVSEFFYESPLWEGQSSIMVSGRGSLIESASDVYLQEQQPLRFNSQLVKLTNMGEHGPCSATLMRTYDRGKIDFQANDSFSWSNLVVGGRCAGVSDKNLVTFAETKLYISHFGNEVSIQDLPNRTSDITKFHFDVNISSAIKQWQFDYGVSVDLRYLSYSMPDLFTNVQANESMYTSSGGYISAHAPLGDQLSLETGLNFTSFIFRAQPSLEPRIRMSWNPGGKEQQELNAAVGIYEQAFVGLSDFRDAGTAFTAWMPTPEDDRRMQSRHALLGWQQQLGKRLDYSIEGYFKKIFDKPIAQWRTVAQSTTEIAYADGTVQGADIRLNYEGRYIYGSIGYGYAFTEMQTVQDHFQTWYGDDVQSYHPAHDRRHQFSAQLGFSYQQFAAHINWVYGSGLPYTRPLGFDSSLIFDDRVPDLNDEYGEPRIILDKPFNGRLPDYHRLDLSIEHGIPLGQTQLTLKAGAVNSYNWDNMFYYDVFNQRGVRQLNFMPYLSVKMESL
ncbi:MAG: TonB-dependent receptor [Bacteroidota bacterium]